MKAPRGIKHKFGHSWASLTKPIFTSQLLHFFDDYLDLKKKKKKEMQQLLLDILLIGP